MKQNKNLWLYLVIGVVAIILIGPKLGLFSIYEGPELSSDIIKSPFIIKYGFENLRPSGLAKDLSEIIDYFNYNTYGLIVLKEPIVFDKTFARTMNINDDEGFVYFGGRPSTKLLNQLNSNSFYFSDLKEIASEFNIYHKNICNNQTILQSLEINKQECKQQKSSDDDYYIIYFWYCYCFYRPDEFFIENNDKLILNLNDIPLFNQNLKLSELKLEISKLGKDTIIIAFNDKGIEEANKIKYHSEFEQYAYEIEHSEAKTVDELEEVSSGYTVMTNDQKVIDASEGKIKETKRGGTLQFLGDCAFTTSGGTCISWWMIIGGIILLFFLFGRK